MVLALNVHQQPPNYVGSIIRECISFMSNFRSLIFLHVRRKTNQAAHYLAKYALKNLDCIWIEETSPCISAVMTFDLLSDFSLMKLSLTSKKIKYYLLYFALNQWKRTVWARVGCNTLNP